MSAPRYQPFYCEENVWWLAQDGERFGERRRWAVFISNAQRRCALWQQRAAPAGEAVVWDYHVVLVVLDAALEVWDLDSRLPLPCPLPRYLDATFGPLPEGASEYAPQFRVVTAETLLARFASDRSHMRRADGRYLHPPPPWSPPTLPGQPSNLLRFIDMTDHVAGQIATLATLPAALRG